MRCASAMVCTTVLAALLATLLAPPVGGLAQHDPRPLKPLEFLGSLAGPVDAYPPQDTPAPRFVIDLDLPPAQRWVEVGTTLRDKLQVTLKWLDGVLDNPAIKELVKSLYAGVLQGKGWSDDQLLEMEGLAKAANASTEIIHYANLFYEFSFGLGPAAASNAPHRHASPIGCTSIVAQNAAGQILHSRNQDYSIPGLPAITMDVQFNRSGAMLYSGTTFAGYIGLPTAMRVGGWSVSVNSRFGGGPIGNVEAARQGAKTVGIFVREAMEAAANFTAAMERMTKTHLISPAYYTVAGVAMGEGAVVTRGREGPDDSHHEGVRSLDLDNGVWFVLETNYDYWDSPPRWDDRRDPAIHGMLYTMGRANVTLPGMYEVLSTPPVLAKDTVYTSSIYPAGGLYHSILRAHTSASP